MDNISDGTWSFYDSWVAFPYNRINERDPNIVGEFMISLDTPGGGSYGEFGIRFYDFADHGTAARLEVFGDGWQALANSHLVDSLAPLDGDHQSPDDIKAMLLGLGYIDKTAELRGDRPARCPTCKGTGVLDELPDEKRT